MRRVTDTELVESCTLRWFGVVTVEVVEESFVMLVFCGSSELMNSVGESTWVGVARRELGRSETELREDCGVLSLAGRVAIVVVFEGLLIAVVLLVVCLVELGVLIKLRRRADGRVLPREESVAVSVLAVDHNSFRVRALDLFWSSDEVVDAVGGLAASMSIASSGRGGGARRRGEAEISSAFRVGVGTLCAS